MKATKPTLEKLLRVIWCIIPCITLIFRTYKGTAAGTGWKSGFDEQKKFVDYSLDAFSCEVVKGTIKFRMA